jgi:hypothetical protein
MLNLDYYLLMVLLMADFYVWLRIVSLPTEYCAGESVLHFIIRRIIAIIKNEYFLW